MLIKFSIRTILTSFLILTTVLSFAYAEKFGNTRVVGNVRGGVWQRVWNTTVSSGTNYVNITGLHGDTEKEYLLQCKFVIGSGLATNFRVYPNNDTANNYGVQSILGTSTTPSASRSGGSTYGAGISIGGVGPAALGFVSQSSSLIYAKSGSSRSFIVDYISGADGTSVLSIGNTGGTWNNNADEITYMVVGSSSSGGIGSGSTIDLYRRTSSQ